MKQTCEHGTSNPNKTKNCWLTHLKQTYAIATRKIQIENNKTWTTGNEKQYLNMTHDT